MDAGDDKADFLDEFAEDYITKPYHYSELRARVQRVLRRVGDRVPRKGLDLGPDRIAPALRPGREPRPDRHDRDPALAGVGRDRGGRAVLRLGDDAPPAPEG